MVSAVYLVAMSRLAVVVLVAVGCADESTTDVDGIYSVDTWTENFTSCDAEGASIKDQREPVFFVKYETLLDYAALNVRTCTDLAECQMEYADDGTLHVGRWGFENTEDGWTDQDVNASVQNGECIAWILNDRLTRHGTDGVRVETRETRVAPFPPDSSGECSDEATLAAGAGMPCTHLEVLTGILLER